MRQIALPTSGVFAEGILGRAISAEKIDITRYIAWDLSNPNQAPTIADMQAGGRGQEIPPLNVTNESGVLQIQPPTALPEPTGFAGAFNALALGTLFRDMSKSEVLGQILGSLARAAETAIQQAANLTGEGQRAALQSATNLATEVAKGVTSAAGSSFDSLTDLGAKLNAGIPTTPPVPTPTPLPVPPTPTPSPAPTPRIRQVRINLRVFVEAEVWEARPSLLAPTNIVDTFFAATRFSGQNRTFSRTAGESMAEAEVVFKIDMQTMEATDFVIKKKQFGRSDIYLASDTVDVPGRPEWFERRSDPTVTPIPRISGGRLEATDRNFRISQERSEQNPVVRFEIEAAPYLPFTVESLAPIPDVTLSIGVASVSAKEALVRLIQSKVFDIDTNIIVTFAKRTDGELTVMVSGTHDAFPSYEVYVNDEVSIYRFTPTSDAAPEHLQQFIGETEEITSPTLEVKRLPDVV